MEYEEAAARVLDSSKRRCFVYHADYDPLMVYENEAKAWYDKGFVDSPAKTKGILKKMGVDKDDKIGVQIAGEAIESVKNALNDELNLDLMKAGELAKYLNDNHGMDVKPQLGKRKLLEIAKDKKAGIIDLEDFVIDSDDDDEVPKY